MSHVYTITLQDKRTEDTDTQILVRQELVK